MRWIALALGVALALTALVGNEFWAKTFEHPYHHRHDVMAWGASEFSSISLMRAMLVVSGLALAALALGGTRLAQSRASAGGAPGVSLPPATRTDLVVLVIAALLALCARIPLMSQSLWYDEIAAFLSYGMHGPGVAVGNAFTQANHVLQSVLSWVCASVWAPTEFALRMPSLVAGVALVPAVWWLGREAGSAGAARAAAVAVAAMPLAILESTEARGYALMALFAALATASLLWALRTRKSGALSVYAIVCALSVLSHFVTVVVPAAHGLWALWHALSARTTSERRVYAAVVCALAVAAMLTLACIAPQLGDLLAIRDEFKVVEGNEPSVIGPQGAMMAMMLGGSWTWWSAILALPLTVVGVAQCVRRPPLRRALFLCTGGVVLALLVPLAGSWIYARFLIFVVPALALAIGVGAQALIERRRDLGVLACIVVGAAWFASLGFLPPRQQIREGVEYIATHRRPNDRAIAIGLPDEVQQWYAVQHSMDITGSGPYGSQLDLKLGVTDPQWVLMLYPRAQPTSVHELLRSKNFEAVARLPGWIDDGDGEVIVYLKKLPPG